MSRRAAHRRRAWAVAVIAALLTLVPGLMVPVVARAAGSGSGGQSPLTTSSNPFSGGLTVPGETAITTSTTPTAIPDTSTSGSGGFSGVSAIAIAVAAFVIIVGIAAAIFRDARKRVGGPRHAEPEERVPGSQRPPKARKLRPAERRRRKRGRAPRRR